MSEQQIDAQLVSRAQRGSREAFDVLVLKYQHRVAKLVGRYMRDQSDVLDATQETFIKAYNALPRFRNECAFYTWLYRIAVNTSKNLHQARKRSTTNTDLVIDDNAVGEHRVILRDESTPEHYLLRDEIQLVVSRTVDALPEELRTTLILRELEGCSYDEISVIMECPIGTVRSRLFRAREVIDTRIKPLMEERGR